MSLPPPCLPLSLSSISCPSLQSISSLSLSVCLCLPPPAPLSLSIPAPGLSHHTSDEHRARGPFLQRLRHLHRVHDNVLRYDWRGRLSELLEMRLRRQLGEGGAAVRKHAWGGGDNRPIGGGPGAAAGGKDAKVCVGLDGVGGWVGIQNRWLLYSTNVTNEAIACTSQLREAEHRLVLLVVDITQTPSREQHTQSRILSVHSVVSYTRAHTLHSFTRELKKVTKPRTPFSVTPPHVTGGSRKKINRFPMRSFHCVDSTRGLTTTESRSERLPPHAGPSVFTISTLAPAA